MTEIMAGSVRIDAWGLTDIGLKRALNEDHFAILSLQRTVQVDHSSLPDPGAMDRLQSPPALLFAVADGVGGGPAGEFASEEAIRHLIEYLSSVAGCYHQMDTDREHEFLEQLEAGLAGAHKRIRGDMPDGTAAGPATTLTMAVLAWPRAYLAHVGDSKAYFLRKGLLRQLTHDQTFGESMVSMGAWTEEQARNAPMSGTLSSALGSSEMTVSVGLVDLQPGDTLLLCTDGLTNHVPDERITQLLEDAPDANSACRTLVDAALADGGTDNVTVLVAQAWEDGAA